MLKALRTWKIIQRNYTYPTPFMHFLKNSLPATNITILDNGLTVATEQRHTQSVCLTLAIKGGTRFELENELGISHFLEHLVFKGTNEKTAKEIQNTIAATGAEFQCRVERELVFISTECLIQNACEAIYLLAECAFHCAPTSEELERQRQIVYEEMKCNDSAYEQLVIDFLHRAAFQGAPLAHNTTGSSAHLCEFNATHIDKYLHRIWIPRRSVLGAVGGVRHNDVVAAAECSTIDAVNHKMTELDNYRYTGSEIRFRDDNVPCGHVAVAVEGPCFCEDDNLTMNVAKAYLGGYHKSHGLTTYHANQLTRGSGHCCESYKAFNFNYMDSGLWGVQFLAKPLDQEDMLFNIQDQWMFLCTSITEGEIERAKYEYKSEVLYQIETNRGSCENMCRWVLYNGCRPQIGELIEHIDDITAEDVRKACMKYVYDKCPSVAAVGATEGLPEYTRIRGGMFWLRF